MKTDGAIPLPSHPLDVDASVGDYAIGLAYMAYLKDEAAMLELLEIDGGAWKRAAAWPERLVDEVGRGETALAATFGAAFKATEALLRGATPPAPAIAPPKTDAAERASMLVLLSNEAAGRAAPDLKAPSTRPEGIATSMSAPPATESARTEPEPWQKRLAALPFEAAAPVAPPSAIAPPSAVEPPAPVPSAKASVNLDSTLEAPAVQLGSALPFGQASADESNRARELSIEQYASLCATLDAFPEKAAIIPQRYGIHRPHDLERVHETWQARFATDPALRATWQRHLREIRARLGDPK